MIISRVLTESLSARLSRPLTCVCRTLANRAKAADDRPVKFTASKAASWNAKSSRGDIKRDAPWFEPYVVMSSIAVFMIYFCVFREENDIDMELNKTLYDRMPGLEKKQLQIALDYNESHGLDTTDITNRLEELEAEEST